MASSKKRKKERVADFQKKKLKVDKSKKKQSNQTEAIINSKPIIINQQIIANGNELPSSQREAFAAEHSLTLLRHHQPTQRKEALQNLTNYYASHRDTLRQNLALIFKSCMPLVSDDSVQVREALFTMLDRIFATCSDPEQLMPEELLPHMPIALLWAHSAMTNINDNVRKDSSKLITWILKVAPEAMLPHQKQTWDCFSTLLGFSKSTGSAKSQSILSQLLSGANKNKEAQCRHVEAFALWIIVCCQQQIPKQSRIIATNQQQLVHPTYLAWINILQPDPLKLFFLDGTERSSQQKGFIFDAFPACLQFLLSAWKEAVAHLQSCKVSSPNPLTNETKALIRGKLSYNFSNAETPTGETFPLRIMKSISLILDSVLQLTKAREVNSDEENNKSNMSAFSKAVFSLQQTVARSTKILPSLETKDSLRDVISVTEKRMISA